MKLIRLEKSPKQFKKFRAYFDNGKHTDFGDSRYEDYTQHKSEARAMRFRNRHLIDLKTNDPTRPGFLSFFILWSRPSLKEGLQLYKLHFDM